MIRAALALALVLASACHARPRVWPTPQELDRRPVTVRPARECINVPSYMLTGPRRLCAEVMH